MLLSVQSINLYSCLLFYAHPEKRSIYLFFKKVNLFSLFLIIINGLGVVLEEREKNKKQKIHHANQLIWNLYKSIPFLKKKIIIIRKGENQINLFLYLLIGLSC